MGRRALNVLIACEFSGVVRDAFIDRGHNAWSCDLYELAEGDYRENHLVGNCLKYIYTANRPVDCWDLLIAHPPCTYLSNSGSRWLRNKDGSKNKERWRNMRRGALFFCMLLNSPIKRICVENPIMHGYARKIVGKPYTQIIQPWQFGTGETKATCLWLKGLPKLEATKICSARNHSIWEKAPSKDRGKWRSRTFPGIARAMAMQWGDEFPKTRRKPTR